ncbi:hypothetical protein HN858_03485 [Candidatus Falkowbacteria bacterium]|jgi:hypothetical protein|nr:hypothetical protein [Candidatus Falkowbacteria bacterium]MBT5503040.1 hypothetical protein [Candidatus Falkowbacteria bacterium]MBT6574141.1 hypothetical protein [Candidatus Falkowbacteria bacterium]MBT7348712.1 hypothetical protein [Candidatus Falkowbacteria bacterium]MBT7500502.1 hypothetical protein [Candidatus Falkowbacteria bacterium]
MKTYIMEIGLVWDNMAAAVDKTECRFSMRGPVSDHDVLIHAQNVFSGFHFDPRDSEIKSVVEVLEEQQETLEDGTVKLVRKTRVVT